MIAVHAVLGLDVADDGLGRRATLYLATDGSRDAADLTRDLNPEPMRAVVAAIPLSTWMRRASAPVSFSMSAITGPSVCPSKGAAPWHGARIARPSEMSREWRY